MREGWKEGRNERRMEGRNERRMEGRSERKTADNYLNFEEREYKEFHFQKIQK